MASQITGVSIICATVCSGADQRKHQSPASHALVGGIHRWSVGSLHKGPVTRKILSFDDVIMIFFQTHADVVGQLPTTATRTSAAEVRASTTEEKTCCRRNLIIMTSPVIILSGLNGVRKWKTAFTLLTFWDWLQWNLSPTTTSVIKFIICDLFSSVF